MSPIFPCRSCGTFIERSAQHYRRVRGEVLCSTCADLRMEQEARGRLHPLHRLWLWLLSSPFDSPTRKR